MDREYKGSSVNKHISDYCVLDLETTGVYILSTKIVEIGLLRVRDDQVVDRYETLVNPNCHIPDSATAVNHITDEMVEYAPQLNEVVDDVRAFIGQDVVVGYNNASFDMNVFYDVCMSVNRGPFTNNYIDIKHAAQRCLKEVDNYKLETISHYFGLDTQGEHRALKDCFLTKSCYDCLYNEFGDAAFVNSSSGSKGGIYRKRHFSPETIALQELHGLVQEIIEDGVITMAELNILSGWMEDHVDLQGYYPFDRIFNALDEVLADGKVTFDELESLKKLFVDFVDPVKSCACHDVVTSIAGKHIVVTGDFDYGNRGAIFSLIEQAGGIIDKSVKKATNYVIVGSKGSEAWKTGNYGSKIEKAMQWNDKGAGIKIIEECEFIPALLDIIESGRLPGTVDWKSDLRKMLEEMITEYELPKGSLYLSDNYGQKDKDKLISNTIYIWEPEYPPTKNMKPGKNKLVMTIYQKSYELEISLRDTQEGDLRDYLPCDAVLINQTKSDLSTGTVRLRIPDTSPNLVPYVKKHTDYCIKSYESKATRFGCCNHFNVCSDAKKCVHENKFYSTACMYRDHLEEGRIFYGKNRNID